MRLHLIRLALAALLLPVIAGCGKQTTAPVTTAAQAPAVPPASSMDFDFSFFDRNGGLAARQAHPNGVEATAARSNWINAVVRVVYINLSMADLFSAPALALNAALQQQAVLGDDGWFTWRYAFTDNGHSVSLRLRARIDGAFVTWQMYATDPQATPALDDFLWFTGESRLDNASGSWVFHDHRAGGSTPVARIDWSSTPGHERLAFRNVEVGSPDAGDQLEYRVDGKQVAVLFHDASDNADADITWNETTGVGSLMVPDYNNGERACWDERQENTVCPADPS